MKTQLFIPQKIKVGYREREDCYTKKLAYVIYYDNKGVLRKETSWKNWIDQGHDGKEWRDGKYITNPDRVREPLPTHDFDNVPTEGFVLNKKVGGYKSDWNFRQAYVRVYDPRGFEFEITVPNLLFILEVCSSFQGKGLEGEFIYSWDQKDLVLLPTKCEDYKASTNFTKIQSDKVNAKDLVPGYSYKTKREENLVYMGKFPWYEFKYCKNGNDKELKTSKPYIFINDNGSFIILSSLILFASQNSDSIVSNYGELVEKLEKNQHISKPIGLKKKLIDTNTVIEKLEKQGGTLYYETEILGQYSCSSFYKKTEHDYISKERVFKGFESNLFYLTIIKFENKLSKINQYNRSDAYNYHSNSKIYSLEEFEKIKFVELYVELENGMEIGFENY